MARCLQTDEARIRNGIRDSNDALPFRRGFTHTGPRPELNRHPTTRHRTRHKRTRPDCLHGSIGRSISTLAGARSGSATRSSTTRRKRVPENLSDQWFEGYVKPAISGSYRLQSSSEIYGKVSVVGERTYGSIPELYGSDVSSFGPEDASIGWRSGKSIGSSENLVDVTIGRPQYRLGHGLLLWDGAAEGGSRGGYWTNARKAFEFAAIGRVKPGPHLGEFFYLDKDELDESDSGTRLLGGNYEYSRGENTTIGATYMKLFAHEDIRPGRDGLNVFNVRAYTAPADRTGQACRSNSSTPPSATARRSTPTRGRSSAPISSVTSPGSRSCRIDMRSSRATIRRPRPTRRSTPCSSASTIGAPGGRARSPASTSSPTPTSGLASDSRARPTLRRDQRRRDLLQLRPRSAAGGRADRHGQGRRYRNRLLHGLEVDQELHRQHRPRVRQSWQRGGAGYGPHLVFQIRDGVPCLQFLTHGSRRIGHPRRPSSFRPPTRSCSR